jgi:hypothetical protein
MLMTIAGLGRKSMGEGRPGDSPGVMVDGGRSSTFASQCRGAGLKAALEFTQTQGGKTNLTNRSCNRPALRRSNFRAARVFLRQ